MNRSLTLASAALFVAGGVLAPSVVQAQAYDRDGPSIITKGATVGKRGLYLIQEGDTLWDLSETFLGEPWGWPSLWSYNPQITNPHWIYPGDMVQVRAPEVAAQTTLVWSESRYTKRKSDLEILARYVGYLPDREFKRSGVIKHARESHEQLGEYDEIYISFAEDVRVRKGDRFTIYRSDGEIEHPHDGTVVGHKIVHVGIAKVLDADQDYVKALILKSYEEMTRGDLVTGLFDHSWVVGPITNETSVEATIVDYHSPVKYGGQFNYVYIDKGRNDGVRRGNRFTVQRRGDGLWYDGAPEPEELDKFPWEIYGEVLVVEAFEETSLGIVSRSIIELERGDRLVMDEGF